MRNSEKIKALFKQNKERDEQTDVAILVIIISLCVIVVLASQLR